MNLEIEADIEAYAMGGFAAGGDGSEGSTGRLSGTLVSNTGQYVGVALWPERPAATRRAPLRRPSMRDTLYPGPSVSFALSTDAGPWRWPDLYCADSGAGETAWWLVGGGATGSFVLQWGLFGEPGEEPVPLVELLEPTMFLASAL